MKRKLLYCILFLTLIFAVGCNKKESAADPTPTATATPTPLPKNLAKENLKQLPAVFDKLAALQPEGTLDFSKGIGYDMTMDITIDPQIIDLLALYGLDLTGLERITAHGTMDMKDSIAMDFTLGLNNSDIINAILYTDSENILFNLPKYSSSYAAASWQELMGAAGEGSAEDISFNFQAAMGLQNIFRDHVSKFVDCFKEEEGFTKDASIGTGTYVITGDKYTIRAHANDMFAVLESLMTELEKVSPAYAMDMEEYRPEENTVFVMDYYSGTDSNYAWAAYPESESDQPLIFVNTPAGFCLYALEEGTANVFMSSVASSENTGIITIPATEEQEEYIIEYEYDDTSCEIYAEIDTMELTMEMVQKGDLIEYDLTMVLDGFSVIVKETINKNHIDVTYTIASLGMKLATISVTTDLRAYNEFSMPKNTADMETWSAGLDQNALLTDLMQLAADYPFIADLILGSGDDSYEYEDDLYYDEEPFVVPEDYTDEFSGMTGYTIDSYGYVDFTPLEDEVLAIGKPSTGSASVTLSDTQKQALLDYASNFFEGYYYENENYYSVWGSVEFDTVASFYQTEHYYADNNDYNNFIFLDFDAVSGDFIDMSIYAGSKKESIQATNEVLAILGVNATVTDKDLVEYFLIDDYVIYSYEDEEYYGVTIEAYEEY